MSKKLENIWYHYKLRILLIAAFALIFIICGIQLFTRTSYDLFSLYAGSANINVSDTGKVTYSGMEKSFREISDDPDLEVTIQCFTWVNPSLAEKYRDEGYYFNLQQNEDAKRNVLTAIANGKCSILLLDPDLYEECVENGALAKLSDTLGYTPDFALDEYGVRLKECDFGRYFAGFKDLPDETVLCLRNSQNGFSLVGKKTDDEAWEKQVEIFRKMIGFTVK